MLRYKILGNSIVSVDLNNGYSIIAISMYDRERSCYHTSLYIKGDTYDTLELIEEKEDVIVKADAKTIKLEVTKLITDLLTDGFFKHYIERYKYMMKCFDKGNEFFEIRLPQSHWL